MTTRRSTTLRQSLEWSSQATWENHPIKRLSVSQKTVIVAMHSQCMLLGTNRGKWWVQFRLMALNGCPQKRPPSSTGNTQQTNRLEFQMDPCQWANKPCLELPLYHGIGKVTTKGQTTSQCTSHLLRVPTTGGHPSNMQPLTQILLIKTPEPNGSKRPLMSDYLKWGSLEIQKSRRIPTSLANRKVSKLVAQIWDAVARANSIKFLFRYWPTLEMK